MAVGDINGDNLDDFYVCGAKGEPGVLFKQTKTGKFVSLQDTLFASVSLSEEINALFFDADKDQDLDLYVVCGGNEFFGNSKHLLDRLYLNNGNGNFTLSQ